jgi:hypothetical protein
VKVLPPIPNGLESNCSGLGKVIPCAGARLVNISFFRCSKAVSWLSHGEDRSATPQCRGRDACRGREGDIGRARGDETSGRVRATCLLVAPDGRGGNP